MPFPVAAPVSGVVPICPREVEREPLPAVGSAPATARGVLPIWPREVLREPVPAVGNAPEDGVAASGAKGNIFGFEIPPLLPAEAAERRAAVAG